MAATIKDLKKEAGRLYKRLERQALNTVNNPEDINRYNYLISKIQGGEQNGRQEILQ
jgi:hypothetical protein